MFLHIPWQPTHVFSNSWGPWYIWEVLYPPIGVFYILVSQPFWDLRFVSIQLDFHMRDVLFMYTIIYHYSMEGYTPIFISSLMWFSLFFFCLVFLCMLVRILSSKIYFLCFFLASLHIALIYYFYRMKGGSFKGVFSWKTHTYLFRH